MLNELRYLTCVVLGSSTEHPSIIGDAQPQYHSSGSHGKELLNLKKN